MTEPCTRILVTGASGFLGGAVVRRALAAGYGVHVLVRPGSPNRKAFSEACTVFEGDVLDAVALQQAMKGVDTVIHLAFAMSGDDADQMRLAVDATRVVVEAMAVAGVSRLVLASSFSVYAGDSVASGVLDESAPIAHTELHQRDGYTHAKIAQEQTAIDACQTAGAELLVLRPGVIWGRGRTKLFCLGQKIGPLFVVIGRNRPVGLTYVENCADAFVAAAVCRMNEKLVTCNITDALDTTAADYIAAARKHEGAGSGLPVPYGLGSLAAKVAWGVSYLVPPLRKRLPGILRPAAFRARFPAAKTPSHHAKQVIGWSPRLDFEASWKHAANKIERTTHE